jgi:hypothetical protein
MAKDTDIEGYYYEGSITKRKMRGLAYFAEKFADADFELGHFAEMAVTANGPRKPTFILSDTANDFVTYCVTEGVVDLQFEDRAEGQVNLGKFAIGGNPVADATPYDLIVLITHVLGNETYWASRLIKAFQSGMLQQILDRSVAWAYPERVEGPLLLELAD